MKNYKTEKFLELPTETDFSGYTNFTYLNKAYRDFIFKLTEVADLLCPCKKLKLKTSSKPSIDCETFSAIRRRDKHLKKYKKFGLETDKDHFRSTKMTLQEAISKKIRSYFQGKIEKKANNSKKLWKAP